MGLIHDHAGLSWGASVLAATMGMRLLLLPISIKMVRGPTYD